MTTSSQDDSGASRAAPARERALLVWDGDCGFCRDAVEVWRQELGAAVDFVPFQELEPERKPAPDAELQATVHLRESDGTVRRGAEAVFRAAYLGGGKRWPWRLYAGLPPLAWLAELGYGLVARRRMAISRVARFWFGGRARLPTYHVSAALFLRLIGLVYFCAFTSLGVQIEGLVGERGLLPAGEHLQRIESYAGEELGAWGLAWRYPTLGWLSTSDPFLKALCTGGALLSLLLVAGICPMPILVLLWLLYLSLIWVGQTFLSFQWDILLVEAGFLAIWLAPAVLRSRLFADRHPPRVAIWLVAWLLFRLMLESGLVKLTWDDPYPAGALGPGGNTWEELTALDYHYWTQPLPLATAWFAAKLPEWWQKLSVLGVLGIELVLPFFIFAPRRLRLVACAGFTLLMLLIAGTGNYNFFNLLTVVLASILLDDRVWPERLTRRVTAKDPSFLTTPTRLRDLLLVPVVALVLVVSVAQLWVAYAPPDPSQRTPAIDWRLGIGQFFLVNDYGLFRRMTETRPEIVISGSDDGITWVPYEFRWKPGDPSRRPGFTGPHQPRLDWQMWFEALDLEYAQRAYGQLDARMTSPWFRALLERIRRGEPQVLRLLAREARQREPPRYLHVDLYQYRFTTAAEKRESGDWWHRELVWRGDLETP